MTAPDRIHDVLRQSGPHTRGAVLAALPDVPLDVVDGALLTLVHTGRAVLKRGAYAVSDAAE